MVSLQLNQQSQICNKKYDNGSMEQASQLPSFTSMVSMCIFSTKGWGRQKQAFLEKYQQIVKEETGLLAY